MHNNTQQDLVQYRYRVVKPIGEGGMGQVYLVEDTLKDNMPFALKTIKQDLLKDLRTLRLNAFKNEYEIMTRLKHPNLTRVYEFGEDEDIYFILMEYLEGRLLSEMTYGHKEAIDIIIQILRALEYIHSRGIVYRDIKPKNIMICANKCKLMDFGLSSSLQERTETIKGTILYMAPEALSGNTNFSMDIFSLGLVFFELITGEPFYPKDTAAFRTIVNILRDKPKFDNFCKVRFRHIYDGELKKIISKMTAYDIKDRYFNCSEIIYEINSRLGLNYEYETKDTKNSYILGNSFADRKQELSRLIGHLTAPKQKNRIFIYSGPVGVGKSRLFSEFKKYCRLNNIFFFECSCNEGNIKNYAGIRELIPQLLTISSGPLLDRFGKYLSLISENSRLKQYSPPVIDDDPKKLQDIIIQNILDYLLFLAEEKKSCLILYFNDLQWIDEGSLCIMKNLLSRMDITGTAPIKIYANMSDDCHYIFNYFEEDRILKYDLHPLDITGVNQYFENVFGKPFLGRNIRESIMEIRERVGGNPLFLEETIKSLIDREIIIKDRQYWRLLSPISEIDIPDNVLEIIKDRLSKIFSDDGKRKTLKLLSLLRIDLNIDIINEVFNRISVPDAAKILLELENLEIIQSAITGNEIIYSYSSSLIKDIIRESIDNKQILCNFLAETLELLNKHTYSEEIAYQFMQAGNTKKAAEYYLLCADEAADNYFNEKAINYYTIASETTQDEIGKANIYLKKSSVLELTGKFDEAELICNECLKISEKHKNEEIMAEAFIRYGNINRAKADFKTAKDYFIRAQALFDKLGDKTSSAKALRNIGIIYYDLGEYNKALDFYDKDRIIQQEMGNEIGIASSAGDKASVYYCLGDYEKALNNYRLIRDIFMKTGKKRAVARAIGNMGLVYYDLCKFDKALECFQKNQKICEDIGDKHGIGFSKSNQGLVYYSIGNYDKAIECHRNFRDIATEIGDKRGIGVSTGNIGLVFYDQKKLNKALKCFEVYRNISEEIGDKRGVGIATSNMGLIFNDQGKYQKALKYFRKYKQIAEEAGNKLGIAIANGNMARVYYNLGDFNRSEQLFELACRTSKEIGDKYGIADAHGNLGNISLDNKDLKKAYELYDNSINIYKELNIVEPAFISYLLQQSRILYMIKKFDSALSKVHEAKRSAIDIKSKKYILYSSIQEIIIKLHNNKPKAEKELRKLLCDTLEKEQKADLLFEIYDICKDSQAREASLSLYQQLYKKAPKYHYKERIALLFEHSSG